MQDFRRPGRSGLRPHRSLRPFSVQPFAFNSFSGAKFAFSNVAGRCLDAAHGVAARTIRIVQRTVLGFGDAKAGPVVVAVGIGGRSPVPRPDADSSQDSRRTVAVARSRRCGRSLEWMARRVRTDDFDASASYGMSGAACGARLRASAAGGCGPHGSKSRTTTKSFARAGCEGRSCGREPAPAQGRMSIHWSQAPRQAGMYSRRSDWGAGGSLNLPDRSGADRGPHRSGSRKAAFEKVNFTDKRKV